MIKTERYETYRRKLMQLVSTVCSQSDLIAEMRDFSFLWDEVLQCEIN